MKHQKLHPFFMLRKHPCSPIIGEYIFLRLFPLKIQKNSIGDGLGEFFLVVFSVEH